MHIEENQITGCFLSISIFSYKKQTNKKKRKKQLFPNFVTLICLLATLALVGLVALVVILHLFIGLFVVFKAKL